MSVTAILFDIENIFFDGTSWHRWVHQQAVSLGVTTPFASFLCEWQRSWLPRVYEGRVEYWPALEDFLRHQTLTECQVLELVISARSRQREVIRNSRPLPGIQQCLTNLKRSGRKIGVICNSVHPSSDLAHRLTQIGLHVPLDVCLTSRSAGRQLPDREALMDLIGQLGGSPAVVAYVSAAEDRLEIARALGMPTVQVARSGNAGSDRPVVGPGSGDCDPASESGAGAGAPASTEAGSVENRPDRACLPMPHAGFRLADIRELYVAFGDEAWPSGNAV